MKKLLTYTVLSTAVAAHSWALASETNDTAKATQATASEKTKKEDQSKTKQASKPIAPPKKVNPWKGTKISAGAVMNTGNTRSQNVNGEGDLNYAWNSWLTLNQAKFQRAQSEKDGVTAQSFFVQTQWQYNFTPDKLNYLYVLGNYLNNKFDGYTYVFNENIGYGRNVPLNKAMTLSVFLGPGMRQDELQGTGDTDFAPSMQLGFNYAWQINDNTTFSEQYQTTSTRDNTNTTSNTSLSTTLMGNLGFSVSLNISYNSKPAKGKKGLDTSTTFNLVYNF